MSDADRRQARQRALTVGACAAVFAFGGPLVAQRFGDQKAQEVYLTEASKFTETLVADAEEGAFPGVQLASFSNSVDPSVLAAAGVVQGISYSANAPAADIIGGVTLRGRDDSSISGLVSFTLEDLGLHKGKDDDLDCLAEAIYYEARSEDTMGQLAVAEVVMNRVKDPRFPNTVCSVVFQGQYRDTGCQFTFTCDGSRRDRPRGEAWDRARDVALHVLLGLNKPLTNKATHYHTDYVDPYWAPGLVQTKVIGTHIFYRFPKTSKEWGNARLALAARAEDKRALEAMGVIVDPELGLEPQLPLDAVADEANALITASLDGDEASAMVPAPATKSLADGSPL